MLDFAAIDFETANEQRSSVCSVGVVIVRNGVVVDKFYSLVRPEPDYFRYWNTRVHGLTAKDVAHAPLFPDVWKSLEPKIAGLPLVAHNSPFDESCLRAVFSVYAMDYPDYEFFCTCKAAQAKLRGLLPNNQLDTVAAYCGFDLAAHHHALADAEACAAIAIKLL
ncbi:MAG: exonuclease domain-containing protein [Marinilabiliaceae bacterium]